MPARKQSEMSNRTIAQRRNAKPATPPKRDNRKRANTRPGGRKADRGD